MTNHRGIKCVRWAGLLAVAWCVCILAGCAAKQNIQYYTINLPVAEAPSANPAGVSLVVGRIEMAPALQDGRIRYRAGKNEVGGYENHRWSEAPSITLRDGLIRLLGSSGKYQSVAQAGTSASADYLVRGKLFDFSEVDDPSLHTRIHLGVEIYDRHRNRVICQKELAQEQPVAGGHAIADVASSLDAGTQAVLKDAVVAINTCLSDRKSETASR
jgi:ABC-type uncharacterized transport system auxiliary subunit